MDNNGDLVFHPMTQEGAIVGNSLGIIGTILMFIIGKINAICFFIILLLLTFLLFILVLFPKKTYIKISNEYLIIGGLDIPTFKTVEKCIQYNNIESINIVFMGIYIKEKDREKKTVIDGFDDKSFNQIKNILIGKGLPVSVSRMVKNKRKTEDFNKNS